ncbi:MAG TPA: hypothetical protein VHL57_01875 [Flavobacteriales bacterium]|jgi:ketosteroid isomerase-like protein|nr:hypothetical protein [Flavobacteriales bacterium]
MRTRTTHALLLSGLAACFVGCSAPPPAPPPAFDVAGAKAKLDSMNRSYDERFRMSDAPYFAARYTTDACVMAPNMPRVCGVSDITAFYWNNGDSKTMALDIRGEEVTGTAQEITEVGNYRVLDDKGTQLDKGKFIAIYRADGANWKVHREIWNSDLAPTAAADSTIAKK